MQCVALLVKVEQNAVMQHLLFHVYNYIRMFSQHLNEKRIKEKISTLQMSQGMLIQCKHVTWFSLQI